MENINKLNKKCFITKILISPKLPNPIRETPVLKLVFITIPCLKFWAQTTLLPCWFESCNFSTYVRLHSRSEKCPKFVCIAVILPGYISCIQRAESTLDSLDGLDGTTECTNKCAKFLWAI